jgi:hypothetical protein
MRKRFIVEYNSEDKNSLIVLSVHVKAKDFSDAESVAETVLHGKGMSTEHLEKAGTFKLQ